MMNPSVENRALAQSSRSLWQKMNATPFSWRTSRAIGAAAKIPGVASLGFAAAFGFGLEYMNEKPNLERGAIKSVGYGAGALGMGLLSKMGRVGMAVNAVLIGGMFLPDGPVKKSIENANYYLMGEGLNDFMLKSHEKNKVLTRGSFGGQKITMNERLIRAQNEAMSMIRQSRGTSMLGREASMMHN